MFLNIECLFLLIISNFHVINTGQFRGGTLSAKMSDQLNKITVDYRLSFQRSYYGNQNCNSDDSHQALEVEGFLSSKQGCRTENISHLPFICTDSSANEDWISGMHNMTFICSSMFVQIGYTGRQWSSVNNGGGAWSLLLSANLSLRSDTRRQNTPPIAVMPPITRILRSCDQVIKIPITDDENDILRCRWSSSEKINECGGICEPMPSIILDEDKCTFNYSGTCNKSIAGLFAVAIQIDDYFSDTMGEPMSSVPLQFLVEVMDGNIPCSGIPNISLSQTSILSQVIEVPVDSNFTERIVATVDDYNNKDLGIETISPIGMTKGPLERLEHNPEVLSRYLDVSWIPGPDQQGRHFFCFMAVTEKRWQSRLGCKILQVIKDQWSSLQSTEKITSISVSTNENDEHATTRVIDNSSISTVTANSSPDQESTINKTPVSLSKNHAKKTTLTSSISLAQESTPVPRTPLTRESSTGIFSSLETSSTRQTTKETQTSMNVTTFTAEWIRETSTSKTGDGETVRGTTLQGKSDKTNIPSITDDMIQSTQIQTSTARVETPGHRENYAFLGGTMYVAMKESSKAQILLRYRLTFYYEHTDFDICSNTVNPFLNKSIISIRIFTNSGCNAVFQENKQIRCTYISKVFNWFSGEGNATFQCNSPFSELQMVGNAGNWTLTANSSLAIRPDTKKVNKPPLAEMLPIQRILLGCQTTIKIPVIDLENDIVRCRWDVNSQNNRYRDVYQRNSGLFLSEEDCSIHINGTMVKDGPYRLAVLVEDFIDDSAKIPMSSSSLKFIVEVLKENLTCDVLPIIHESSFQDEPVLIKVGSTYTKRLTVSSNPPNEIIAIETLSPQGMFQSPLKETECPSGYDGISKRDSLRKCWFVIIIWVPTTNGKYLLCFFAVNHIHLTSPQQCQELSVDVDTEEYKENGEWTTGDIVGLVFGILATLLAIPGTVIAVWQIRKCRE